MAIFWFSAPVGRFLHIFFKFSKAGKNDRKGLENGILAENFEKIKIIFFFRRQNPPNGRATKFSKISTQAEVMAILKKNLGNGRSCCCCLLLAWYEVADHPKVQFTHLDLPNRKTERGMCRKQRGDPRGGLDWPCSRLLMCLPLAPGPTQTQILRV